ncbi:DUF1803 domain-containing protein [Streptococcus phocae]|uniref:DUF1803 domain-containing protein n=1 Tax=Streptococcus phocae TaxID=119224 RepID=A0A0N8FX28_9STRE|nr:DUF1803 domain-containing protein [Streptococcus phocae]KPJ21971.1 hypothetical protein AKK44_06950 [Streptococcus phocae]
MIRLFNPDKLMRQPFFKDLVAYLDQHDEVILRQLKKDFPEVKNLDRSIEAYVKAAYISRENRRYRLTLPLVTDMTALRLEDTIAIDTNSPLYEELLSLTFDTQLTNQTNQVIIQESTGIDREKLTLANYFYRLKRQESLSADQKKLYALLGDVNQEYALKYLTSFLLKFTKKEVVMQKRPDIFVDALVFLGYISPLEEHRYRLQMTTTEPLKFQAKR